MLANWHRHGECRSIRLTRCRSGSGVPAAGAPIALRLRRLGWHRPIYCSGPREHPAYRVLTAGPPGKPWLAQRV